MGFTIKLTKENIEQAKGGSFEPLPKGVYGATIVSAKVGNSKSSGNPMYTIEYNVEHSGGRTRKIKGWHVIAGPGSFSSANLLKALGLPFPGKDTEAGEFEFPDGDELIGETLNVKVGVQSYETINPDTGEEETRYSNNIAGTFPYDENMHSAPGDEDDSPSGNLL